MKPVRSFSKRKVTGRFPSEKSGIMHKWESMSIEREYFYFLEFDDDVLAYYEQPFRINYIYKGECRYYTPDVFVVRKNKRQVVELKPKKFIEDEENKIKFEAGRLYCQKKGYEFVLITDEDLNSGFILKNIKFLHGYSRQTVPLNFKLAVLDYLSKEQVSASIGELASQLAQNVPGYDPRSFLYNLMYFKIIKIDLNQEINKSSIVTLF